MNTAPINSVMPSRSTDTAGSSSTAGSAANSASSAITNAAGGAMGKDEFVKLLVTQMKNQDPMNPLDGKDLAAQLAQFSSVEQLMNINTKLDSLNTLLTPATHTTPGSTFATTQGA